MDDASRRLRDALVAGFRPYAEARAVGLGPGRLDEAIHRGLQLLEAGLDELFAAPVAQQRETPLQVFRSALEPVVAAMVESGISEGDEDEIESRGPASAADVSPEALEASLVWGATKAAAMTRPVMLVVTTNLMDVGSFESAARRVGYRAVRVDAGAVAEHVAAVAFVDLETAGADDAISELARAGVRTVAYGPHVDSFAMTRATSLGAAAAEPRSRVLRDPAAFVSPVV